jgi:hypothetical protein
MPQLDTLTYFTQYIWFITIFLSFYVILSNKFIPTIATVIKVRNKIKFNNTLNNDKNINEVVNEKILLETLIENNKVNNNIINELNNWSVSNVDSINEKALIESNNKYISIIGTYLLKKNHKKKIY